MISRDTIKVSLLRFDALPVFPFHCSGHYSKISPVRQCSYAPSFPFSPYFPMYRFIAIPRLNARWAESDGEGGERGSGRGRDVIETNKVRSRLRGQGLRCRCKCSMGLVCQALRVERLSCRCKRGEWRAGAPSLITMK